MNSLLTMIGVVMASGVVTIAVLLVVAAYFLRGNE
jgi:hypothetical protein